MGATYTRQSSGTIVDGSTIEASHFNDEFDQLLAAFAVSSGHTHDGTAAEGGPVTKLLGTAITIGDGTSGTDIAVTFDGETNDGVLTWMEDEDLFKFTDVINVGVDDAGHDVKFFGDTASRYWLWDTSADGVVQLGTLTVGVDDAGYDVKFFGNTASAYMLWDTSADDLVLAGAAGIDLAGDIDVDGTANLDVVDIDGAVQIDNTVTVGVDDTGYDVKYFGASAGAYALWDESSNLLDLRGATSAGPGHLKLTTGELTVVDADVLGKIEFQAPLESDGSDAILVGAAIWAEADDTFAAGVNNTDLVFALGKSEAAAEKFRFTADNEIGIAGANYGTDGQVLTSGGAGAAVAWEDTIGTITAFTNGADNRIVTGTSSTALNAEANLSFTGSALTCIGTMTVGVDDTGHDVKLFGASAGAYMEWDESADQLRIMGASADATTSTGKLLLATSLTDINANDVIGKIDFQAPHEAGGTDAITVAASIQAIAQDTFSGSVNATDLIFYTGHSEAATEKYRFTSQGEIGIGGANYGTDGQVLTSGGAGAAAAWESVSSAAVTALNSATVNELVTVGSTTTELDAEANLTFTGSALTCIGTITVGVDDTGHDVKFFGATASSYMEWDESENSLVLNAATLDLNGTADGLILDANGNTTISSPTDDQIDIEIAGADDFTFTANTFTALSGSTIAIAAGGAITNAGTMAPDITSTGKAMVLGF